MTASVNARLGFVYAEICKLKEWTSLRQMLRLSHGALFVLALLVMSIVLNLATQQIDFSNAFCQADIDEEVYVEMPKDFGDPRGRDMVLRLNKSLYEKKGT